MKPLQAKTKDITMQPLSSVFLQSLIYFNSLYAVLYFVMEGFIFFYKGFGFYYPESTISQDIIILITFGICELIRLQMGSIGNKTESSSHIGWFIVIILPAIAGYIYFLFLQTYVLVIETVLNSIGLAFLGFEFFSGVIALSSFKNFEKKPF